MQRLMIPTLLVSVFLFAASPAEARRPTICYSYQAVDVPPSLSAGETTWSGINDSGVVVGNTLNVSGTHFIGALYNVRTKKFEVLPPPAPYTDSFPGGINNRGEIVGYFVGPDGLASYLRDKDGAYTILPAPALNPGLQGASGLNDRGQIVGFVVDPNEDVFFFRGLIWDSPTSTPRVYNASVTGGQTTASDISNQGAIIGGADDDGRFRGFIDRGKGPVFFDGAPGAEVTEAPTISNRGHIVGYYQRSLSAGDPRRGYVKTRLGVRPIDFPGASDTAPLGLNSYGTVVGTYDGFSFGFVAFPRICFSR